MRHQDIGRNLIGSDHPKSLFFEKTRNPGQEAIIASTERPEKPWQLP